MPTADKRMETAAGGVRSDPRLHAPSVFEPDGTASERDSISIDAAISYFWRARSYVLAGLVLCGALGGVAAFILMPVYRAQVVVVPASYGGISGLSGVVGQVSELAAIAGLGVQRSENTVEYLEFLKSRTLTERFIVDKALLPVLYSNRWDERRKAWNVKDPNDIPTVTAAVREFNDRIRSVSEDRRTNVVTLAINWRDREQAAQWANEYIELANRELSRRAIDEAQSTLNYLNGELPRAPSIGVQQALYHLIEDQQKIIAFASTHKEFAFKVVDPAYIPGRREYVRPNRPLIIFASTMLGSVIGLVAWRIRRARWSRRERVID